MGHPDLTKLAHQPLFAQRPSVSQLCLGAMMFGDRTDAAEAGRILDAFLAAGGSFIDTADSYAGGDSERMLGELLGSRRDQVVLATKVGNPVRGVENSGGLSRAWILEAARMSLERLATDRVDLYYLHLEDDETPIEETLGALGELMERGAIRSWGFSNFRPWKIAEMVRIADRLGVARPRVAQPYYHLLNRIVEADYLPACRHFGIAAVPYSPLARGVLTGKYRDGTPEGSRAGRGDKRMGETEFFPETIALASRVADYAVETGRTAPGLAVQWVLAADTVGQVLVGPRTLDQLEGYLDAADTPYTAADEAFLSGLCIPGHTAVPGHNDPRYPLQGRRTPFDAASASPGNA